jgi:hypothetical protein
MRALLTTDGSNESKDALRAASPLLTCEDREATTAFRCAGIRCVKTVASSRTHSFWRRRGRRMRITDEQRVRQAQFFTGRQQIDIVPRRTSRPASLRLYLNADRTRRAG